MEKFAVDLDRVLDEFESNEDYAEQVASSTDSGNMLVPTPMKRNMEGLSNFAQSTSRESSTYDDRNSQSTKTLESQQTGEKTLNVDSSRINETLNLRKDEPKHEKSESINDFYTRGRSIDEKVQQKRYVDFRDGEPVSLTIHNDISQKLVQKRQNESAPVGSKNHNSYDKKLNQPNIKPSVSNVFSSLNDYINAPSGNIEHSDNNSIVRQDTRHSSKQESAVKIPSENEKAIMGEDFGAIAAGTISHETDIPKVVETYGVNKYASSALPKYQNILLPVKLDSDVNRSRRDIGEVRNFAESTNSEGANVGTSLNAGGNSVISGDVGITTSIISINTGGGSMSSGHTSANLVEPSSKTIPESRLPATSIKIHTSLEPNTSKSASEIEHVYENVYIPTDVRNVQEIYTSAKTTSGSTFKSSEREEPRHVYENINFEPKIADNDCKTGGYERIYVGNDKDSTEIPIAEEASGGISINRVVNSKSQNIKSTAVPAEREVVVGFSTIDDLSEDELNKYLAELEAEERAIEGKPLYENVPYVEPVREDGMLRHVASTSTSRKHRTEDEDANEAPIFETVTIGVLPTVSEEKLQEKAKKFPVIDYSKQQGTSSGVETRPSDFLEKKGSEKFIAPAKAISEAGIKEERCKDFRNKNEKSLGDKNGNTQVPTSMESLETIEPRLSISSAIGNSFSTEVLTENKSWTVDHSYVSTNDDSGKDSPTRIMEANENKTDNAVIEFEDKGATEGSISSGEDLAIQPGASDNINDNNGPSSNFTFAENNETSSTGENSNNANDEDGAFGISTSLENGLADSENSNKDDEDDAEDKLTRPQTLDIVSTIGMDGNTTTGSLGLTPENQERLEVEGEAPQDTRDHLQDVSDNSSLESGTILGKQPPFWIPDSEAPNCMLCDVRFNVIKRRHHCRACGKVLCNKCCSMKYRLEYQGNIDSRVCSPCYQLLVKEQEHGNIDCSSAYANNSPSNINSSQGRQPNPNNPMEYCSTIPPLQQLAGGLPPPPTVMVPVGVLKREGSSKQRPEGQKSVMFSDGIRPGCDLTELDTSWDLKPPYRKIGKRASTPGQTSATAVAKRQNTPPLDPNTNCYIPQDPELLPPAVTIHKGQITYHEAVEPASLYKSLKNECEPPIMFAINRNLYAYVKITNLNCCVNRICWNITSRGLASVGQDEIILLVETLPDETQIPKDLLVHINQIYIEAIKGNTITELGVSIHQGGHFLGSREHAGFLFIRQTFQCLQKIILPPAPFLVGLLVHRWETPWAKVFPLRLMLRLGAEYRYYPCPLVSVRFRDAVYFEIGHTIMKVLADFRNFAYTLAGVRGLTIHMQDRVTDVLFPKNRYDQVIKGLNNSNDHVLAFASNFSVQSDSHLVCIQTNTGDESNYQTQAINIHNKPRKVTGASFVVINGALKSSMGLSAKTSIVEDGLMVQIMPEKMEALKASLKNMQDFSINCGLQGAPEPDETVNIKWVDNDVQFNLGVKSPIDGKAMDGIPSIRVHNGTDYMGTSRFIRWTEVFIIKSDDHPAGVHDPVDINKLSESIARATCAALVKLLDLLATAGLTKLAVRTTIYPDNVGYEAGSEGTRLPPIYMNSLDNELIQVLHKAAQSSQDTNTVLELIFHVLDD